MFKLLSQQLRGTLTTAIERQISVEDFTDVDQGSFLSKYLETKTDEGA